MTRAGSESRRVVHKNPPSRANSGETRPKPDRASEHGQKDWKGLLDPLVRVLHSYSWMRIRRKRSQSSRNKLLDRGLAAFILGFVCPGEWWRLGEPD